MPSTAAKSSVAQSTPAARLPERLVRLRPKRKITNEVIAKSAIAGQRLQGAELGAEVLAEDRREGGARGGHAIAAASRRSSRRSTWSASGR